jgi:hypothetical protein
MAKSRAKKADAKATEQTNEPLDPNMIHELLGIPGPYEPPLPPITTKGYVTWWDVRSVG